MTTTSSSSVARPSRRQRAILGRGKSQLSRGDIAWASTICYGRPLSLLAALGSPQLAQDISKISDLLSSSWFRPCSSLTPHQGSLWTFHMRHCPLHHQRLRLLNNYENIEQLADIIA